MRSKEVEEAIKVLDKYKIRLLQTRKEIGLVEDFKNHHTEKQYNRCGKRAKSTDTVLSYIEELENARSPYFIPKAIIRIKIEEYKGKIQELYKKDLWKEPDYTILKLKYQYYIEVLESLLGE